MPRVFAGSIRVLLVEDSLLLAERIAEVLRYLPGIDLVGVVDTEEAAVAAIGRQRVDIVVLDLHLKEGTGFGVLRAIGVFSERPRVIVLTNYDLPEYKEAAMSLGATAFLDKARDFFRLPDLLATMTSEPRVGVS